MLKVTQLGSKKSYSWKKVKSMQLPSERRVCRAQQQQMDLPKPLGFSRNLVLQHIWFALKQSCCPAAVLGVGFCQFNLAGCTPACTDAIQLPVGSPCYMETWVQRPQQPSKGNGSSSSAAALWRRTLWSWYSTHRPWCCSDPAPASF